jgi:phospho-acceptor domain-containing protein
VLREDLLEARSQHAFDQAKLPFDTQPEKTAATRGERIEHSRRRIFSQTQSLADTRSIHHSTFTTHHSKTVTRGPFDATISGRYPRRTTQAMVDAPTPVPGNLDEIRKISHDVRSCLSVIVSYIELLLDDPGQFSDDQKREWLRRIRQQSMRAASLMEALEARGRPDPPKP